MIFSFMVIKKIFELFQRLHNKENYSGTGIELAIVHKNVAHLGGEIRVFSELDKGSWFEFTISKKLIET